MKGNKIRRDRWAALWRVVTILWLALALAAIQPVAADESRPTPTPPKTEWDFYRYAWDLFLDLNQPAADGRVIWETWKASDEVFLPCAQRPAPWGATVEKYLGQTRQVDGRVLLDRDGEAIRYEIRMNQPVFETILNRGWYDRDRQIAYFRDEGPPLEFPPESIEIKAAWRILQPGHDQMNAYYTASGYYLEGEKRMGVTVGLTGLHIASKILPGWVWMTFEHRDNQQATAAPLIAPIATTVRAINAAVHRTLPADSIWRHYDLRGVQWTFEGTLTNTQIESYFQRSSSCTTCHALASIGAPEDGRLFFFDLTTGQGVTGDPRRIALMSADGDPLTYRAGVGFVDARGQRRYKPLDYVWSLLAAQSSCK